MLPACVDQGVKIISNQGWINPEGAAARVAEHLKALGATGMKVAAVGGSLITDRVLELTSTDPRRRAPDLGAPRTS